MSTIPRCIRTTVPRGTPCQPRLILHMASPHSTHGKPTYTGIHSPHSLARRRAVPSPSSPSPCICVITVTDSVLDVARRRRDCAYSICYLFLSSLSHPSPRSPSDCPIAIHAVRPDLAPRLLPPSRRPNGRPTPHLSQLHAPARTRSVDDDFAIRSSPAIAPSPSTTTYRYGYPPPAFPQCGTC